MSARTSNIGANVDPETVAGFGDEWARFDFADHTPKELDEIFSQYFSLFPWDALPAAAQGFDAGCGSGRWAARVAPRVGKLHCIDASPEALDVARRNCAHHDNCSFMAADVDNMPLGDATMDFGYSLGVLHHVPNTASALATCVRKLKPGAPFLVYLYYALDNRGAAYRTIWRLSDAVRSRVSRLPLTARYAVSQVIAASIYWPLARAAAVVERAGGDPSRIPLHAYRHRSFYVMRNDALDRFGTRLEQRFTRLQIAEMMERAGLDRIAFRDAAPYWCALGYRK